MRRNFLLTLSITLLLSMAAQAQAPRQSRIWYGNYTLYKLNKRWFFDNYLLTSFGSRSHRFSFLQNDLALNYRLDKSQSIYLSYSLLTVRWIRAFEERYDNPISSLNTIQFNRVAFGYKKMNRLTRTLRLRHDIAGQVYFPSLEKFRYRFVYRSKLYLRNRDWPLQVSPFGQFALYYYNGGNEVRLDEDGQRPDNGDPSFITLEAPNGLHRYRIKFGVSFKPFVSYKKLGMTLYYAYNREFNFGGLGNNLNVYNETVEQTYYRFNNYHIYGIQLNVILN